MRVTGTWQLSMAEMDVESRLLEGQWLLLVIDSVKCLFSPIALLLFRFMD